MKPGTAAPERRDVRAEADAGPDVVAGAADGADELQAFVYAVSHDLAEPLRAITGFVQLLERSAGSELDEEELEYLGFISDGADRMRALLDGVLAYSRVVTEAEGPAPVDLAVTTEAVFGELADEVAAVGADVRVGTLPTVVGDERQLRRALHELVANALRFRHPDRAPIIDVGACPADGGWTIWVADNGIGIDDRDRSKVFGIYSRLHHRDEYEGVGVGLALVARIVQRHGGRVWVADGIDGGASICTYLPTPGPSR